jgi:hypothetical protein
MSNDTTEEGRIALTEDAPKVNLEALVLVNYGIKILEKHPLMGRVIVATQDLDASLLHRPILRELPALVCKQEDYMDFMEQFLESPIELQVGLLDMFYQPLDSAIGKSLLEPAKVLFLVGALEDLTVLHQLLSILMTNGHQYQVTYTAIPLFASKFSHSCAPNMGYSSLASDDGALEYKLLRPVSKGDLVSFSYLSDLLETPTNERRKLLMETKSFWCSCDRCIGPDYCRCMPCQNCSAKVPCRYPDQSNEAYWECTKCGMLEADTLTVVERQIGKTLEMINRRIEQRKDFDSKNSDYSPAAIQEMVSECQVELSETHHLTVKALRLLFSTATAHAFVSIKQMMIRGLPIAVPRIHSLLRTSIIAGYQLVLAGECVAAECSGCQLQNRSGDGDVDLVLRPTHEPNYDRALAFRHICDNLLRLPIFWWPHQALTMTLRYLPILKARFGQIVAHIEYHITQAHNDVMCFECGTYWNAFSRATSPPPSDTAIPQEKPLDRVDSPTATHKSANKGKAGNKKRNNKKKKRRK